LAYISLNVIVKEDFMEGYHFQERIPKKTQIGSEWYLNLAGC